MTSANHWYAMLSMSGVTGLPNVHQMHFIAPENTGSWKWTYFGYMSFGDIDCSRLLLLLNRVSVDVPLLSWGKNVFMLKVTNPKNRSIFAHTEANWDAMTQHDPCDSLSWADGFIRCLWLRKGRRLSCLKLKISLYQRCSDDILERFCMLMELLKTVAKLF